MEAEVTVPNSLSPLSYRRGSFTKQSHSLDDKEGFTSSLPLAFTTKDLDDLKVRESSSKTQTWQNGLNAQRRGSGGLLSPLSPTSLGASRPRSASLYSSRKSFLGISKNRPSSVKRTGGKQGADSAKESGTFAIDTALAKIRNQLEQLSLEDQAMEERVNRLTSEISQLMSVQQNGRNCLSVPSLLQAPPEPYRCYKRTRSDEPLRHKLLHNFDGHQGNVILSDLKETCEELSLEKGAEEEVDCVPSFDLNCKEFVESPCKRESLDSTGSVDLESVTEPPVGEVCVVIVTDTSEQSSQGTTGTSQTSGSSQAEDDVFFPQ